MTRDAILDHFKRNRFEFPGNPNGLAEGFTTPHDIATTVDVIDADGDFWGATTEPLEDLRRSYGVPPVDPTMLA